MSLGELLLHPAGQELHKQMMDAHRRIGQALETQGQLQEEILRLVSMLQPHSHLNRM